jgi:hypothetical protein
MASPERLTSKSPAYAAQQHAEEPMVDRTQRMTKRDARLDWQRRIAIAGVVVAAILAGGMLVLVMSGRDEARLLAAESHAGAIQLAELSADAASHLWSGH